MVAPGFISVSNEIPRIIHSDAFDRITEATAHRFVIKLLLYFIKVVGCALLRVRGDVQRETIQLALKNR